MQLVHYTDPACPFAYSAEPQRLRLSWHYGDQLPVRTRLVVLSSAAEQLEAKGFTPAKAAAIMRRVSKQHGMPFDTSERPRLVVARPACLAVAAAQLHAAERADALLRQLRLDYMGGVGLLDVDTTIAGAAEAVGLDPAQLHAWMGEDAAAERLAEDMQAARTPLQSAKVLDHKLAAAEDGRRRYSTPTWELHAGDRTYVLPGFQPWETYDVAVANADPAIERRAAPEDVDEVLAWAPHALATAEVAALLDIGHAAARERLEQSGARFEPLGDDGLWSAA